MHEPREIQRKGNFPYKFKIETDFVYEDTGWILTKDYISKWLYISKEGVITVRANDKGYSWDGCTPKWSVFNLFIIGTPDGHVNYRTMKPYTYYASLVHDALYQYLDTVPIKKVDIDSLFLKMLGDFKPRWIYYLAVRIGGGNGVRQNKCKKVESYEVSNMDKATKSNNYLTHIIAISAVLISAANIYASVRDSRTDLYISFKNRYHEIRKEVPHDRRSENFDYSTPKNITYFNSYWNLAFDEWYASNELFGFGVSFLWDDYYSDAIADALTRSYYVDSLCHLKNNDGLSYRADVKEFFSVLNDLYLSNNKGKKDLYLTCKEKKK